MPISNWPPVWRPQSEPVKRGRPPKAPELSIAIVPPKRKRKPKRKPRALTHKRVVDIGNDAIQRISTALTKMIDADPAHWRRLRYAVSLEEWHCISAAIKATGEPFYGRLKDIPLIVEGMPDKPTMAANY
jgi:hypothetical protein